MGAAAQRWLGARPEDQANGPPQAADARSTKHRRNKTHSAGLGWGTVGIVVTSVILATSQAKKRGLASGHSPSYAALKSHWIKEEQALGMQSQQQSTENVK